MTNERRFSAHDMIVALNEKNHGDWNKVFDDIKSHIPVDNWLDLVDEQLGETITMIDEEYPEYVKRTNKPPFVLYYEGDLGLLGTDKVRIAIGLDRHADEKMTQKAIKDLAKLPNNFVIVTNSCDIIRGLRDSDSVKIIVVKPCGLGEKAPRLTATDEKLVLSKGGLIITSFPDEVEAESYNCISATMLRAALSNAVLVVSATARSSVEVLICAALSAGRDVLAYPTCPGQEELLNNKLIQTGATLVENTEDIISNLN